MQDITSTTDNTVRAALAGAPDAHQPKTYGRIHARDLHPGDVVRQHDWPLHVYEVTLSPAAVTIAVTEFEFPLHYAADEPIQVLN